MSTVAKYSHDAAAAGQDLPAIVDMSEKALERHLFKGRPNKPSAIAQPDCMQVHHELRRKGMTLQLLWEEYTEANSEQATYSYSQFCERYRRFALNVKTSMRQTHKAGEKMFIDYAGTTVAMASQERAHIFVAALGASGYTFAWATERETTANWLQGRTHALTFFGGVPQMIVPDNPKAIEAPIPTGTSPL